MKLDLPILSLITETLTRLGDAYLNELGTDTNTYIRLPDLPLVNNQDEVIGHYRWSGNDDSWYFDTDLTTKEN